MSSPPISIPDDLLQLKPSDDLESVSMSRLARTGTAVLRQLTATAQAVAVKVQGQGAMVTLSQRQYDEMVALIGQLRDAQSDDGFTEALRQEFDELVTQMNRPGASEATGRALSGDPASLNDSYQPGATEKR